MNAEQLDAAFDRIDAFLAVQSPGLTIDAVNLLQEAVGVDADARAIVRERVAALAAGPHAPTAGAVLLGILVGLFAADEDGDDS